MKFTLDELNRLRNLESELLSTRYVADVVEQKAMPTPEEVEAYYNENQAQFLRPVRVGLRHILVDRRETADNLVAQLEAGAEFGALARQHSKDDATKDLGGALGFLSAGKAVLSIGRDRDFERFVLAMEEGETGVVRTSMGFHVVRAEKKEGGDLKPLEEVYDRIASSMLPQRFGRIYNEELLAAREATEARYITENFEEFTGADRNTLRLLEMAATVPEARSKAEAYRRLAYDFPDSPEAPEALFRMGYVLLVEVGDKEQARKVLTRLRRKYTLSKWRRAADYLIENIDMDVEALGTPEEIVEQQSRKGR